MPRHLVLKVWCSRRRHSGPAASSTSLMAFHASPPSPALPADIESVEIEKEEKQPSIHHYEDVSDADGSVYVVDPDAERRYADPVIYSSRSRSYILQTGTKTGLAHCSGIHVSLLPVLYR